jgi:predicted nucleic-acid-binding Zn-ribbon protein
MPGIFQLTCEACDYSVLGGEACMSVVMDDGSETICSHPGERRCAERVTGKSWRQLARANRLIYRYALVCLSCGKMDYYGPHDISQTQTGGHYSRYLHQPSLREAVAYSCKTCGVKQLYPLCGDMEKGCFYLLLGFFHREPQKKVNCPKCRNGTLMLKMVGKS